MTSLAVSRQSMSVIDRLDHCFLIKHCFQHKLGHIVLLNGKNTLSTP